MLLYFYIFIIIYFLNELYYFIYYSADIKNIALVV